MKHIRLYDTDGSTFLAILENATDKSYEKQLNDLWTASFTMPADDPKSKLCTPFRVIELFDNDERVDLFRILPLSHSSDEAGETIVFECEHVLATLVDDILFQYHEQVNITTFNVLSYILGFQTVIKWQLGTVAFAYLYSYKWESENLLASIFAVAEPILDDYQWTWDTTTQPWTLNLIAPDTDVKSYVQYGKNLDGVTKDTDPTYLCTRMYCLGYGEGVNQLTINDVNGGLPYIDADTQGTYGIISRIYADTKEEDIETLKAKAEAALEGIKIPRIEYSFGAAHLYQITENSIDDFYVGAYCKVTDKDDNLSFVARVTKITKPDIDGNPGNIKIEIANSPEDISSSISTLANRQRINEVYAQGATNIDSHDYVDNCDATHPAIIRFYIPEETVRINKMQLNYESEAFRAYSQATAGGGATSDTTASGGAISTSTQNGGGVVDSMWFSERGSVDFGTTLDSFQSFIKSDSHNHDGSVSISGTTGSGGDPAHTHSFSDSDSFTTDNDSHFHLLYDFRMFTNIPSHDHDFTIPNHTHGFSIPNHTHEITPGIFTSTTHTTVTVTVDGNTVPGLGINENNVDIIPYLSKDGDGKINRGQWHEVQITPNAIGRISANIISQFFIQSRGGGDY